MTEPTEIFSGDVGNDDAGCKQGELEDAGPIPGEALRISDEVVANREEHQ